MVPATLPVTPIIALISCFGQLSPLSINPERLGVQFSIISKTFRVAEITGLM
jgi:hypothetical protein